MTSTTDAAISVSGLTKVFGENAGLCGVDLEVDTASVVALLGPNGAGKTTMVRILATLLRPDAGTVRVGGYDALREPRRVQELIGMTGQSASLDNTLSGLENLRMFGRLHRLRWPVVRERSTRLLEMFDLGSAGGRAVKTYSGGMRRKLDLAVSLMAEPTILFLDEPTTGLDPAGRQALWEVIRDLVRRGTTVLLTTQYLDEADALADSVVFLDHGRVAATGTPAELKARVGGAQFDLIAVSDSDFAGLTHYLDGFPIVADAQRRTVSVAVSGTGAAGLRELGTLIEAAARSGVGIEHCAMREPDLNDVYFRLTGHSRPTALAGVA